MNSSSNLQLDGEEGIFEQLLGSVPDSVLLLDANNVIIYANRQATEFMQRGDKPLVGQDFGIPLSASGEVSEVEIFTGKGFRTAEMRLSDIMIEDNKMRLLSLRDITEAAEFRNQYQTMIRSAVEALSRAVEERDPYTAGHQGRVAKIAVHIAKKMGMSEEFQQGLFFAGLLHDIGKIAVPASVLTKPTKLEPEEMELIKLHTKIGHRIVKDIEFPWPIADGLRHHHERLDGSGYPDQLYGNEIGLESQILGVADTVDAMMEDRPYRKSRGIEATVNVLEDSAGNKLNAEACRICAKDLKSGELNLWTKS